MRREYFFPRLKSSLFPGVTINFCNQLSLLHFPDIDPDGPQIIFENGHRQLLYSLVLDMLTHVGGVVCLFSGGLSFG